MKHAMIAISVLAFGTVFTSASIAQGRHDDKPHASTQPSADKIEYERVPVWGGRHDERPHGPRKPAPKKTSSPAGAEKTPESDKSGK